MSGKGSKNHKSSLFSRFKKRVSSVISPSTSASSRLPSDNAGTLDTSSCDVDHHLAPPPLSHRPSASSFAAHSIANSVPAHPFQSPQHPANYLEDSICQDSSSTYLAPPSLLQHPQGQASTYQGPNPSQGAFNGAHDFVMYNPTLIDYSTTMDNFMEKLLQCTIIGAEFDSSDRDPPPRCHPGTRLEIIQRCLDFIGQCHTEGKLRWVVGPAGVGKSAVMQMVTEKVCDGVIFASIFFSINGRADGSKAILTIAYQFAVKFEPYHQYIQYRINHDPSLLRKSLSVQFNTLIVEPFMLHCIFDPCRQFLIIIDGLDECDNPSTQEELLKLITDFCIIYPTSPLAWIIASRPEPHITAFFDQDDVKKAYTKEEIQIDSDEAREGVELYLRDELKKIKLKYPTLKYKREWPSEHEFTRIASSARGLFAYAATVVRYIDDPKCRNPAAQLHRVLKTIDATPNNHTRGRGHPMAGLDALYKRILSSIPDDVMTDARKLFLCLIFGWYPYFTFRKLCNMLGLTEDDAYGAISYLHAVMKVPELDKADEASLSLYHKSFEDFLRDSTRSGFSDNVHDEARQLCVQALLRIIGEVPYDSDSVASDVEISLDPGGWVKGYCDNITLSWPEDERFQLNDHQLRVQLYNDAMGGICLHFSSDDSYEGKSMFHALTTRFTVLGSMFPLAGLRTYVFDESRRELTELGKLKQVPLRALDYAATCRSIDLCFTSPIETDVELSDPWNPSCEDEHELYELTGLQQRRGWSTWFNRYYQEDLPSEDEKDIDIPRFHTVMCQKSHQACFVGDGCIHCSKRFAQHFMDNQDLLATVFVDGTQMSYVEFSFLDPDDGVSEWTYRFCHSGPPTSIDA